MGSDRGAGSRSQVSILPNSRRAILAFLHDTVMAALSLVLSLFLRLGTGISDYHPRLLLVYVASFALVAAAVFLVTGLYRGIWRYASLPDLVNIARAATLSILVFLPVMFLLTRLAALPRSTLVIDWFVLSTLLGAPRLLYRVMKDRRLDHIFERGRERRVPVLILGTKDGADVFIREMVRDPRAVYEVVGALADTPSRVGRSLYGVPVLGTVEKLERVVAALEARGRRPQKLILHAGSLSAAALRSLLERADALAIPLARLPKLTHFERNLESGEKIVEPIALEDLLGRPQAVLDRDSMARLVRGKSVLVTGAGGTIGGELCRQIAALEPGRLALADNSEFALYEIDLELRERFPGLSPLAWLRDMRERREIDEIMAAMRPDIVFHAAALKHVPLAEANPLEAVLTNVVGTRNLAESARGFGVSQLVMISTDKAVNPAGVMGATKRLAESLCQALDLYEARRPAAPGTRFVTVRFGNVLGSTGSVVPLFQRQLAAGGPLTVTHPEVSRYFMTVREAVELVLQASALAPEADSSVARGKIFVLDMGEPVKILDLARQMIRLAGRRPDRDITVEFTGLRAGEKLTEELFHGEEPLLPTANPAIRLAAPRTADYAMLARAIEELEEHARARREERALDLLAALVPEYRRGQRNRAHVVVG
jgi:FlaA1/EpsC-like NDP-sugar epimerase